MTILARSARRPGCRVHPAWVVAAVAFAAGIARDRTGTYAVAWFSAALLCVVAAVISVRVSRSSAVAV